MIARHPREPLGFDSRIVQHLGERLVLSRRADFGEIPREYHVVRADAPRGVERPPQLAARRRGRLRRPPPLAAPPFGIEGPPETEESCLHRPTRPSPARAKVEHVRIGQMRNARSPRRFHGCLSWFRPRLRPRRGRALSRKSASTTLRNLPGRCSSERLLLKGWPLDKTSRGHNGNVFASSVDNLGTVSTWSLAIHPVRR